MENEQLEKVLLIRCFLENSQIDQVDEDLVVLPADSQELGSQRGETFEVSAVTHQLEDEVLDAQKLIVKWLAGNRVKARL